MKQIRRKITTLLLTAALLLQICAPAFAAVGESLGRSAAENETILSALQGMQGGNAEAVAAQLKKLGLLDENGALKLSGSLTLDGVEMTLAEVGAMLEEPGVDLTRMAQVDGSAVSLGDLKTILAIEAELARIQATYFPDAGFSAEAEQNLNSLLNQMGSEGLMVAGAVNQSANKPYVSFSTPVTTVVKAFDENCANRKTTMTITRNGTIYQNGVFYFNLMNVNSYTLADYKPTENSTAEGSTVVTNDGYKPTTQALTKGEAVRLEVSHGNSWKADVTVYWKATGTYAHGAVYMEAHSAYYIMLTADNLPGVTVRALDSAESAQDWSGFGRNTTFKNETQGYLEKKRGIATEKEGMLNISLPILPEQSSLAYRYLDGLDLMEQGITLNLDSTVGYSNYVRVPHKLLSNGFVKGTDEILLIPNTDKPYPMKFERIDSYANDPPVLALNVRPLLDTIPLKEYTYKYPALGSAVSLIGNTNNITFPVRGKPMIYEADTYEGKEYSWNVWEDEMTAPPAEFWTTLHLSTEVHSATGVTLPRGGNGLSLKASVNSADKNFKEFNKKEYTYSQLINVSSDTYPSMAPGIDQVSYPAKNNFAVFLKEATLEIIDKQAPTIVEASIAAPAGTYRTGQIVPIHVEFSERVSANTAQIVANGVTLDSADKTTNGSVYAEKFHLFEYPVQAVDNAQIVINSIRATDLLGNTVNDTDGYTVADVSLQSCYMSKAVSDVAAEKTSLESTQAADGTKLTLTLVQGDGYKTKYTNYDTEAGKETDTAPFVAVCNETGKQVPFMLVESESGTPKVLSAVAQTGALEFGTSEKTYTFQIYAYERQSGNTWSTALVDTAKEVTVKVKPMVFVNGVTVKYPEKDKTALSLTDPYVPTLAPIFAGNPTYQSGTWTSSAPEIATIDASGAVTLAGGALGEVSFTFVADDGGQPGTPYPDAAARTATSHTYTVTVGAEAGIVVPQGGDTIIAQKNATAQVRWYGNLKQYLVPDNETNVVTYTVEVFAGNIAPDGVFANPVYTKAGLALESNSTIIPENILANLSLNGEPAYTVRISAPHPNKTYGEKGMKLSTCAYLLVNPVPAKVSLTKPTKIYYTAGESINLGWNVENYEESTVVELTVEQIPQSGAAVTTTETLTGASGSKTIEPAAVVGLRSICLVTLRAKNTSDPAWNSDSFSAYVYNPDTLDILVDGVKTDEVKLSNRKWDAVPPPSATDEIMELRQKLGLSALVGINYADHPWSTLKDGISWQSGDQDKVSVNFKQGTRFEDIRFFGYGSYLPESTMAIAGHGETEKTTITATHANTGMHSSISVKVESLQNRLYLFQMTPMQKTDLTYKSGKGTEKTVSTNDQGTLALYEPDGIASDIQCKAVAEKDVYLGTLYIENLRSGEGNSLKMELYPLNTLTLRKVASTQIFLKKPDGTPYSGYVTVRGGVYKNGGYCQTALFGINDSSVASGLTPRTLSVSDGKLSLAFDITQFWSEDLGETVANSDKLQAQDKLEYIFELTGLGAYLPLLCYADGVSAPELSLRSGESVFTVETGAAAKPFLARQRALDIQSVIRDVRYAALHLGPNELAANGTVLESTYLLLGESKLDTKAYTLELRDEFGFKPQGQTSEIITYPFSSIPVVRNAATLDQKTLTLSGWIPELETRGLKLRLLQNGALQQELPLQLKAVDLTNAPKMSESPAVTGMIKDMKNGSVLSGSSGVSDKNKVVSILLDILSKKSGPIDSSNFKMIISPGDDAVTFNAFIWAGVNTMGIPEADYGPEGLYVQPRLLEVEDEPGFSSADAMNLADGAQKGMSALSDLASKGKNISGGGSMGGQLEGFYEAQIQYNFDKGKWELYTLGGGFTVGFGGSFGKSTNQMVGPVPVTASFELGAMLQLDLKAKTRYAKMGDGLDWASTVESQYVSDFMTTLRIYAYFEAFGGFGFDITIVALKIGLFGRLTLDNSNAFLSRDYLANESLRQQNGQIIQLTGEVGIKLVAKILGIGYDVVLASGTLTWNKNFNNWNGIQDYWAKTGSGLKQSSLADAAASYAAQNGLQVISAQARLESRDYLDQFDRSWAGPMRTRSLDPENGLAALAENVYPYVTPQVTGDGTELIYLDDGGVKDVNATRVYTSTLAAGSYPAGSAIAAPADGFTGFGDSAPRLAGDSNLAVAAWVRQNAPIDGKPGKPVGKTTLSVMMNTTEVMAAVKMGGNWTTTRLTNNGSPDLAPVVATNGSKAIVAWRSVYAGDAEKPMDFNVQDNVLYQIYDGGAWGKVKVLYPGTSGVVKGIEAAMLPDGTAAVAYALDRVGSGNPNDFEVAYSIVDNLGAQGRTVILTGDQALDENPQLAAVNFGTDDDRFVMGWHSYRDDKSDIRLSSFNAQGLPSASFPESISQISETANVGAEFRFVAAKKLEELSLIWAAGSDTPKENDLLWAVKFLPEGESIALSAPLSVAELPERTLANHFSAYSVPATSGNTVKAVIQGTEYSNTQFDTYTDADGVEVKVPQENTKLFTATANYQNTVTLNSLWADYQNLAPKSLATVRFTLTNSGMEPLTGVKVTLGGIATEFTNLALAPNESVVLTCYHAVGDTITDPSYTVLPSFGENPAPQLAGTLHLNYPDVGIAKAEITAETKGKRNLRVTLYNGAQSKLAGSGATLKLAFYDNADCTGEPVMPALSRSAPAELLLADNGALCVDAEFNLDQYLIDQNEKENGEVPALGVLFYAKAWIEKGGQEQPEVNTMNNRSNVKLESLLHRMGEPVTITVEQSVGAKGTDASVTVRNNSLAQSTSGSLTVNLLDQSGNVLETRRSYNPLGRASNGLITLAGEGSETTKFSFTKTGTAVTATYGALAIGELDNAQLTALTASGVPVRLAGFAPDKKDPTKLVQSVSTAADSTRVTALPKNPNASVTINGAAAAEGGTAVALMSGENKILVEVLAEDGVTKQSYALTVTRTTSDAGTAIAYRINATAGVGGKITPNGSVSVMENTSKTFEILPDAGFVIADLLVDGVSVGKPATYRFPKVQKNHSIEAKFARTPQPYIDVSESDWFYDAVRALTEKGVINGMGEKQFAPQVTSTRGMVLTMLYRRSGSPGVQTDQTQWYAAARAWAMREGISDGTNMEQSITREQLVTLLWRANGSAQAEADALRAFSDMDQISPWAKDAMAWGVKTGLIEGSGGKLNPTGNATRAEAAVIFLRGEAPR